MKPEPEPFDPTDVARLARETMARAPFPMLATTDGDHPRVRPVSPVRVEDFTVFVASLRGSHKTREIDANSQVELCYMDEGHDQVRISGIADLVEDFDVRQSIWDENPLLRGFLGSIDNPEFMLYRIDPHEVRFMREWALDYHQVPI